MKKKNLLFLIILVIGIITATRVYAQTITNIFISGRYNYDKSNEVFTLVNEERAKAGINLLEQDLNLTEKANIRAREVALYFSHTRPNGEMVLTSMSLNGENIAAGSSTATGVMNQWMTSSGHKANILSKNFKSIGIGSYTTKDNVTYWVQVFSEKKSTNNKKLTGFIDKENEIVQIKNTYLRQLSILDLKNNKTLAPGEEYQIKNLDLRNEGWPAVTTTISPKNAKWTSSNTEIATIDNNGLIKALKAGSTTITARVSNLVVSYQIEVKVKEINIQKITLPKTKFDLKQGESAHIDVNIIPENTTNDKKLTYTSSNEEIATVDSNGNITAKKSGTSKITITSSNKKTATCYVHVTKDIIPITGINITNAKTKMYVGSTLTLSTKIEPANANEKLTWSSSNDKIATISDNGVIKALSKGKVSITASSSRAATKIDLTIKEKETINNTQSNNIQSKEIPIESVSLNCEEITLKIGESFHFEYNIYPHNATEKPNPTWVGMYYKIAELGFDNTIVAKQAGEGIVSVIVGKNNLTASCKVKVIATNEVKSIKINDVPRFKVGEARVLDVEVYPETSRIYGSIKYTSSNPEIVSVSEYDGLLISHQRGTAIITATAPNGVIGTKEIIVE